MLLFIGVCPKDTIHNSGSLSLSVPLTAYCSWILSVHSFDLLSILFGTQTHIILVVCWLFFLVAGSNRLFDIFDTICYFGLFTRIPESDSVVCSVLFLWFRSLLFHSNIKHLIAMAHEINRLTTTRARENRTKKRKPNNNYFHFCGNKLFVVHKLIVQSDLAHSSSSTSTSSWLKTSTAHE